MEITELKPIFPSLQTFGKPLLIAGPCSAESREQTLRTAQELAREGVKVFRAGVWKPRTKPGCFEGAGEKALPWLAEVKERTGMLIATEVACREHLDAALKYGIDVIWLGARTTVNPFAVQEIADRIAEMPEDGRERLTILIKNPINPDIELWLGAIERIYAAGARRIGAVHRGFSSYGNRRYRNTPMWRIPIELHRRMPTMPILCDPSHIGGDKALIEPLAQQALDMHFDGLVVESHCDPGRALSDAFQQITPRRLGEIMRILRMPGADVKEESLDALREQIDSIDDELLDLLSRRMKVSRDIGQFKRRRGMSVVQPDRYGALIKRRAAEAVELGLSEEFVRNLLEVVHEESVRQQVENAPEE